MLICVQLFGGLGNQLFQYATAYSLSRREKALLILDASGIEIPLRAFELSKLRLPYFVVIDRNNNALSARITYRLVRRLVRGAQTFCEPSMSFCSDVLSLGAPIKLAGCFQSPQYFEEFEQSIRALVYDRNLHFIKNNPLYRKIRGTPSVSIHVRRGDYANSALHTHISAKVGTCQFYVFSDDVEWARRSGFFPGGTAYASDSSGGAISDLLLMATCDHNIIANSTFSWWSAWLNPNPNKIVIAPARWTIADEHASPDICPNDWVML
jgi:hypothetical protein